MIEEQKRPGWQTCAHENTFDEHLCWKVTEPDLEGLETEKKFCGAKVDGVIRRFDHPLMGFMEPKQNDHMITKKCAGCNQPVLLLLEEQLCQLCKYKEEVRISLLQIQNQ